LIKVISLNYHFNTHSTSNGVSTTTSNNNHKVDFLPVQACMVHNKSKKTKLQCGHVCWFSCILSAFCHLITVGLLSLILVTFISLITLQVVDMPCYFLTKISHRKWCIHAYYTRPKQLTSMWISIDSKIIISCIKTVWTLGELM